MNTKMSEDKQCMQRGKLDWELDHEGIGNNYKKSFGN